MTTFQETQKRYARQRYNRLVKEGFPPEQAKYIVKMGTPLWTPEMRSIRRYQAGIQREAKKAGMPESDIREYIRQGYRDKGWTDESGRISERNAQKYMNFVQKEIFEREIKQRRSFVDIDAGSFTTFKMLRKLGMTDKQARERSENVTYNQTIDRINSKQYETLRRNNIPTREALEIVLAKTSNNKKYEKIPNLNTPEWRKFFKAYGEQYKKLYNKYRSKGYNTTLARSKAVMDMERNLNSDLDLGWQLFRQRYQKIK